jgi:hypothetical protein
MRSTWLLSTKSFNAMAVHCPAGEWPLQSHGDSQLNDRNEARSGRSADGSRSHRGKLTNRHGTNKVPNKYDQLDRFRPSESSGRSHSIVYVSKYLMTRFLTAATREKESGGNIQSSSIIQ